MKLETLYKRTKTGKIQYWQIEVLGSTITKTSGQLNTDKPLVHKEVITTGKNIGKVNETSPEEQAVSQAKSDWNSKRDEGYKSLTDLNLVIHDDPRLGTVYTENFGLRCSTNMLGSALERVLPQFNTGVSGAIKPMKAPTTPWKPGKKLKFPQQYEPKLDGNRATLTITDEGAEFRSSGDKVITTLQHLVDIASASPLRGKFDGEVYRHGWTLRQINKAIKKLRPETLELCFHMFDIPDSTEVQTIRTDLTKRASLIINHAQFPVSKAVIIYSEAEIIALHDVWVKEQGYEGGMLKDPNGTYQQGQRSSYWNKVKMFDDAEFEVVGYELGQRGVQDLIFVCKHEDRTFNAVMNGTLAEKQEYFAEIDSYIGKQLTVRYFGFTDLGVPNIAKGKDFRDDL